MANCTDVHHKKLSILVLVTPIHRRFALLHLGASCEESLPRQTWSAPNGRPGLSAIVYGMPVFTKGGRFHDTSVLSHRSWTVLRKVGEGQSAEVYSVRSDDNSSAQVRLKHHPYCHISSDGLKCYVCLIVCCQDRARARDQDPQSGVEGMCLNGIASTFDLQGVANLNGVYSQAHPSLCAYETLT